VVAVVINGGMVDLTPIESGGTPAILQSGYPCQSAGTAIAGAVFGDFSPSARLTSTYYADFAATVPPMDNYTMVNRTYRYHAGPHLYPFGFGLSYTNFSYTNLVVIPSPHTTTTTTTTPTSTVFLTPCQSLTLNVTVTNTGGVLGAEVAQLYLSLPNSTVRTPLRSLIVRCCSSSSSSSSLFRSFFSPSVV